MRETFEEFLATKEEVSDLAGRLPMQLDEEFRNHPGFIYDGCLWIEKMRVFILATEHCTDLYYLILDRDDYISSDLRDLEEKLWHWSHVDFGIGTAHQPKEVV